MYALLDFGDLRIEQQTEFSKVKSYYKGELVDDYKQFCDTKYIESIENFFKETIIKFAFFDCKSLINVEIPEIVSSIGTRAFWNCANLSSITIPEGITSIGDTAFAHCTSLTDIIIPNSVTSIGNSAFESCKSLASITIPDSVTSIGNYVFYGCHNLISVTIPSSVTSIGNGAFAYCLNLINTIYKGTVYADKSELIIALKNNGVLVNTHVFDYNTKLVG